MSAFQIIAAVVCLGVTVVALALVGQSVARTIAGFRLGQPDSSRTGEPTARTVTLVREFLGHTRMSRLPVVAVAHWFTMISFGVLFFTLINAFGQLFDPAFALPVIGHFPPYEWITDIFAFGGFLAILVLIGIRQRRHPRDHGRTSRFYGSTFWQAYYVEATILGVTLCIGLLRALEWTLAGKNGTGTDTFWHFPLTGWIGNFFSGMSVDGVEQLIVAIAAVKILISVAWLITIAMVPTMGVAWHRFFAFFNIWFKRHANGRTSLGALQPMAVNGVPVDFEAIEDLDEDAALGVGKVTDFTWKGLLDFATCTECGRCQSQCPAWNTDKPLSPKLLMTTLRDHAHAARTGALDGKDLALIGPTGYADVESEGAGQGTHGVAGGGALAAYQPLGPDGAVIDPDVLWSCTTCGACVEQCPVDIEHVDAIVDMRRFQVLIESAFPSELAGLFKNLENKSNPWGMAPRARMDWAKGLAFDVPVVGSDIEDLSEVDYLFWVGCAGAFEDRAKKTTRAVVELLHTAGVSFAVLGDGETCTGDPARRAGNEFLFQMLAQANVEVLTEAKATKVVVTCAHCFNTLRNEYPQLGGHYQVLHHTQLLNDLVGDHRLVPVTRPGEADTTGAASTAASVTYHDPCYLGRHNGVYSPPRELLSALPGVALTEMPRAGFTSFCCGAGGARMWMEEKLGTRINGARTAEAVGTGAERIAIACPFCRVMLSDGLTAAQADGSAPEQVQVVDIAQMLLAAVRPAPESEQPSTRPA